MDLSPYDWEVRWLAMLSVGATLLACGDDGGGSAGMTGSSGNTGSSSMTATSSTEASTSESGSSSGSATSGGAPGVCDSPGPCRVAMDCCLNNEPGCPDAYPNRFSCEAGYCVDLGCEPGDCAEGWECHPFDGNMGCFEPCPEGSECQEGISFCMTAEDDASICVFGDPPDCPSCHCASDDDCTLSSGGKGGLCEVATGECICTQDGQCEAGFWCVPG